MKKKKNKCITKASRSGVKYIVQRPDGIRHVVLVDNNCKMRDCDGCYGKVIISKVFVGHSMEETIYRDTFKVTKTQRVVKDMAATNFYSKLTSEFQLIPVVIQNSRITHPYDAYDRSPTHKTDCFECKQKHKAKGILPFCKRVEENKKEGLPEHFCPSPRQRVVKVW
jgi:hypothetical protein